MYLCAVNNIVSYNSNGSITSLQRSGMRNNGTFGLIDSLTITYSGNRLLKVTDDAEALNYNGALDFNDGDDATCEYDYDGNGFLKRDGNRGISGTTFDYSHHPNKINMSALRKYVKYDHASDGRKLLSLHSAFIPNGNGSYTRILTRDLYADGLILRGDTTLMWLFGGGYVELDANGTPTSWNYYVTDHLGSTRMVVDSNGSIKETVNYYPFGSEMMMENPALLTGNFQHPYRFTGKELDKLNGLNMYDFGARLYDVAGVPMWTSIDPLAEKYYNLSPYNYCGGNPVMMVDPDGCSTWVKQVGEGLYEVIGGDLKDKDFNIYVYTQDDNGEYTIRGESIGITATPTSFYNSDVKDEEQRWRGYIDTRDNSGIDFLNMITGNDAPNIVKYMYHARENQKYDFKRTNGEDNPIDGIDIYRGMPISTDLQGRTTYASARDIGNMAAGYIAAKNGISWKHARWAFDKYQGSKEGPSTINAELYGYFRLGRSTAIQTIHRILRNRK